MYLARITTDSDFDKALSGTINRGDMILIFDFALLNLHHFDCVYVYPPASDLIIKENRGRSMRFHLLSPESFHSVTTICTCKITSPNGANHAN